MKKLLMLSVAALALSVSAAFAEEGIEGRPHRGDMFEKIDSDKDGAISKAEFTAFRDARFVEMDKDGDGKVAKEEGEAHRAEWKAKMKEEHAKKKAEKAADAPAETPPVETPAAE